MSLTTIIVLTITPQSEVFSTSIMLKEAKVLIEHWRRDYNQAHPHNAQGYRSPLMKLS
jgi:hypothetical protein